MGRTKSSGHGSKDSKSTSTGESSSGHRPDVNVKIKDILKDLTTLCRQIYVERNKSEEHVGSITKTRHRIMQEKKMTPYYRTKLKCFCQTAIQDAEIEIGLIKQALERITEIKSLKESGGSYKRQIFRRGVLMNTLAQSAQTLPMWVGRGSERAPPLCGSNPAELSYIGRPGDKVAAKVRGQDDEENWILAEIVSYNSSTGKYEVDDIDSEQGKERHTLSRKRIVPLPVWKANPETDPGALFTKGTLVLALYPQTTCFYRALIQEPPKKGGDSYSVLFEDTSYPDGYSPPLSIAQRYVIMYKEDKKK